VVTISRMRGQVHQLADGTAAFVTIHPSFLLRIQDAMDKQREYRNLDHRFHETYSILRGFIWPGKVCRLTDL
jgi:hypothetical protein